MASYSTHPTKTKPRAKRSFLSKLSRHNHGTPENSKEYKQLASIFDSVDVIVYISDPHTYEILYVNEPLRRLFGDVTGKKCHQVFQNLGSPCPFCTNKYIFGRKTGHPYVWDFYNKVTERWYHCIDKAIRWPDGRWVRYEMAIDITERKKTEEKLRWLGRAVEQSIDGIAIADIKGTIQFVNKAWIKMHGYKSAEALIGKNLSVFHTVTQLKDEVIPFNEKVKQVSFCKGEVGHVKQDGTVFPTLMTTTILKDKNQNPIGFVGVARDITAQKRAQEERKQNFEKLARVTEGTIRAMSMATEIRDYYTAGHQRRVSDLAFAIACEMNLTRDQTEATRVAAILHDIGKLSIPAEILTKPCRLTETEFNLVKAHSEVGYNILKSIEFLFPVAQIVLQHHERINGSGYPYGLKGDEILIEAKVLGVADVVEATASHRPYRPARGIDRALHEVSKRAGVLYDRDVVATCLRLFKKKGFKFA